MVMVVLESGRWFTLKNIAIGFLVFNLLAFVLFMHSIFFRAQSLPQSLQLDAELLRHIEEADRTRHAMEPVDLIKRVKQIQLESEYGEHIGIHENLQREHQATQLSKRLNVRNSGDLHKALAEWRKRKMERAKRHM